MIKISHSRIKALVRRERKSWAYVGPLENDGLYHYRKADGGTCGFPSEEQAKRQMEAGIAFKILEKIGIENPHAFDWPLWANDAEFMIKKIIHLENQSRQASKDIAALNAILTGRAERS